MCYVRVVQLRHAATAATVGTRHSIWRFSARSGATSRLRATNPMPSGGSVRLSSESSPLGLLPVHGDQPGARHPLLPELRA